MLCLNLLSGKNKNLLVKLYRNCLLVDQKQEEKEKVLLNLSYRSLPIVDI